MKKVFYVLMAIIIGVAAWWFLSDQSVAQHRTQKPISDYANLETEFQNLFQSAKNGDTIALPEGHFIFTKSLILDGKKNIVIKGAGIDKTVLSFRNQAQGAEGIRVANASNIIVQDFTIQDALGDNIKTIYVDTIVFRNIKTEWTFDFDPELVGAYGLYPVICKNVTIENCVALRASDSGIYVGQSENIVIRNNDVLENVCGINVENCGNVAIYKNTTHHNTSGITVLDIPGLTRYSDNIHIYDNKIYDNNLKNFAPKGNVAANTYQGSGIMLWAAKQAKIENNDFSGQAFPIMLVSFLSSKKISAQIDHGTKTRMIEEREKASISIEASLRDDEIHAQMEKDKNYSPYNQGVTIGKNTYDYGSFRKRIDHKDGFLTALVLKAKNYPIFYDGVPNPKGNTVCVEDAVSKIVDLDILNDSKNVQILEKTEGLCKK